jgi:hypothetical protein
LGVRSGRITRADVMQVTAKCEYGLQLRAGVGKGQKAFEPNSVHYLFLYHEFVNKEKIFLIGKSTG